MVRPFDRLRLIEHFTKAAWSWRAEFRKAKANGMGPTYLNWLDGRYAEARESCEYVRSL